MNLLFYIVQLLQTLKYLLKWKLPPLLLKVQNQNQKKTRERKRRRATHQSSQYYSDNVTRYCVRHWVKETRGKHKKKEKTQRQKDKKKEKYKKKGKTQKGKKTQKRKRQKKGKDRTKRELNYFRNKFFKLWWSSNWSDWYIHFKTKSI